MRGSGLASSSSVTTPIGINRAIYSYFVNLSPTVRAPLGLLVAGVHFLQYLLQGLDRIWEPGTFEAPAT
jgi:hypothetical protein